MRVYSWKKYAETMCGNNVRGTNVRNKCAEIVCGEKNVRKKCAKYCAGKNVRKECAEIMCGKNPSTQPSGY